MANTTINTAEIDALFDNLFDLFDGQGRTEFLETVGERVGILAENYAREYPERIEGRPLPKIYNLDGRPSAFKSRRQRAFVMHLVMDGKVPRTRSGFLGNSISHKVTVSDTSVLVRVGSNLEYAPYPLDDERQNRYLNSLGWIPLGKRNEAHIDEIRAEVVNTATFFLRKKVVGR